MSRCGGNQRTSANSATGGAVTGKKVQMSDQHSRHLTASEVPHTAPSSRANLCTPAHKQPTMSPELDALLRVVAREFVRRKTFESDGTQRVNGR